MAARGHAITVYAENPDSKERPDEMVEGVRVRYRRRPPLGAASVLAYDCSCLWDARKNYDLVYMLGYGAAWACWLPRVFGVPVWINVDGLEWSRSKWGRFARMYLRAMEWVSSWTATRVIADARAMAERFQRLYRRGAPCSYLAYGAPLVTDDQVGKDLLARWALQAGSYFLVVARAEPENHILEIIEGYLQHEGSWPLVVVSDVSGATPYQRQLQKFAEPRVQFVGGVYHAPTLQALRVHAGAYLHGHSVGGTNPSLLEALACGNWVVAHDNPFNREVAGDAADYFSTPVQLAQQLNSWAQRTPFERQKRAEAARQVIRSRYHWEDIADAYEELMLQECGR